jgi:Uncharacterized conserved protein (COG2071)
MRIPTMIATIERRLLVNYRVDPDVVAAMLPAPLRPQLVRGSAVAGICLIRLGGLRPQGLPGAVGLRTENAAHRIAVEWDGAPGEPPRLGVFIPRRHTASRPTTWFGGRLFPGRHDRARFCVHESDSEQRVAFSSVSSARSTKGGCDVDVTLTVAPAWPGGSALFADLAEASRFFRLSSAGYSPTRDPNRLEGLELETEGWRVEPGLVSRARSSFFDDPALFPPGSAELDTALVMRDVAVRWRVLPPLQIGSRSRPEQSAVI